MKINRSLRTRMVIAFLLIASIAISSMAVMMYVLTRSNVVNQATQTLSSLAQSQAATICTEITGETELLIAASTNHSLHQALETANAAYSGDEAAIRAQIDKLDKTWRAADAANNNEDPLVQSVLSNEVSDELKEFIENFADHVEVFATDKYGASIASTGRTSDYNQADEDWWQTAYNNGQGAVYIGEPEFDASTQTHAINIAVPVKEAATGEVIGVLRSTYQTQALRSFLEGIKFGKSGQADLIFPNGEMIAPGTTEVKVDAAVLAELGKKTSNSSILTYRGVPRLVILEDVASAEEEDSPVNQLGWKLVAYQDSSEVFQPLNNQSLIVTFVALGVTFVTALMALFSARFIASPIVRLNEVAKQFAAGNLNAQAKVESDDEIGKLADTFNHMTGQLRNSIENEQAQRANLEKTISQYADFTHQVMLGKLKTRLALNGNAQNHDDPLVQLGESLNEMTASLQRMISQTRDAAADLSSAATEILAATTQQASGATEQSAAITQTTSTVNEVKTISEHSTARLNDVATTSQRTVEITRSGQKSVQEMIESMAQIKERVEAIAENTLALSEQTQQIGEIITTVSEIAAQSNILALNASVEAARAGEHGKGFAVVAMEVRNLAEQSKQATAQVKMILSEIQKATNMTVMATEEGAKGVDVGVQLASQARESIEKLGGSVNEATQVATQVVAGGQQLQTGIDQIAMAIQQISQVTVQSLASTRQTEKSAQNLNELARRLNEDIAQYEL